MSGGRLVALDRSGREIKAYSLPTGLVRIGRGNSCQIKVLQSAVELVHASLLVNNAQTVIRNESNGVTLVNGHPISVAGLQHNDVITIGDRALRWEYSQPSTRPNHAETALQPLATSLSGRRRRRPARASSPLSSPSLARDIEMKHRASMPASAGGKQVAIVQPQRRDETQQHESCVPGRVSLSPRAKRARSSKSESDLALPTKATLWIESRKSSSKPFTPNPASPKRPASRHISPKTATPRQTSPRKTPKQNTSLDLTLDLPSNTSTPRNISPRKSAGKKASAKKQTPKMLSPRPSTSRNVTIDLLTPTQVSPRKSSKIETPKNLSPRKSTSRNNTLTSNISSPKPTPKKSPRGKARLSSPKKSPRGKSSPSLLISPKLSTKKSPRVSITPLSPRSAKQSPRTLTPQKSPKSAKKSPRSTLTPQITAKKSPRGSSTLLATAETSLSATLTPQITAKKSPRSTFTPKLSAKKSARGTLTPQIAKKSPRGTLTPQLSAKKSPRGTLTPQTAKKSLRVSSTPLQSDTSINATLTPRLSKKSPRSTPQTSAKKSPRTLTPQVTTKKSPRGSLTPKLTPAPSPRGALTPHPVLSPRAARGVGVSAKKATPLRLAVLKKAQSAHKAKVMKIEEPARIDLTKQAAIMLMTGHTPKSRLSGSILAPIKFSISPKPAPASPRLATPKAATPTLVIKKHSPIRSAGRKSKGRGSSSKKSKSPKASKSSSQRSSGRRGPRTSVSVLEITDSESQSSLVSLGSPRKSALKDPRNTTRKTESIKFDLSHLDRDQDDDIISITYTNQSKSPVSSDSTLRYSESPKSPTPSPRRSIHSRSSKILEQAGSPFKPAQNSPKVNKPSLAATSPRSRASKIIAKALASQSESVISQNDSRASRRSQNTTAASATKSINESWDTTVQSAFRSRTLSPRNMESYSVVDLVSMDDHSNASASIYDSLETTRSSSIVFGTPQTGRKSRSTITSQAVSSSTPYVSRGRSSTKSNSLSNASKISPKNQSRKSLSTPENVKQTSLNSTTLSRGRQSTRSNSSPNIRQSANNQTTRRSQSLTTPENSKHISLNSTKISRASKSRSRINDSEVQFLDMSVEESPKSSRKSKPKQSPKTDEKRQSRRKLTIDVSRALEGTVTPENQHSPEDAETPKFSIQSLLSTSQSSFASQQSKKSRSPTLKRHTIAVPRSKSKRSSKNSKSFTASARKSLRALNLNESNTAKESTPTSAVKIVQEAVKNKHSTAKKPQSKRSIIDDLNESDIVKQLFNSPVKRKLSQSMTEMSRRHVFDDDVPKRTRNTIHLTGRSLDNDSVLDRSEQYTPEDFVSPLNTPGSSPNFSEVKLVYKKNSRRNDTSNIAGVKSLLNSPKTRKSSILTGVKQVFAMSPKNDLRRVSGVKSLFQSNKKTKGKSPRNDLSDVRGVKDLFKRKSVRNDLQNVSGVKKALAKSPKNDLRDVGGVKRIFAKETRNSYSDLSGVEELLNESHHIKDPERLFDQLIGKPPIKAVYSKSFSKATKPKRLQRSSLRKSIEIITNNVEQWIEKKLNETLQKKSKSTPKVSKELQNLATDTVEGNELRKSRVRESTVINSLAQEGVKKAASLLYSARKLPIKKRSFVEASLEKSSTSNVSLPIKKRAVVHSTPVKGRPDLTITMNATGLRAVSPIVAIDDTGDLYEIVRSPKRANQSKQVASPKKPASPVSPKPPGRRAKQTLDVPVPSPKGRRTKAVIPKALPSTPKGKGGKAKAQSVVQKSPKPKRATKSQEESMPSPKPRGRRANVETKSPERKGKTKKAAEKTVVTPKSPKPKRGRKNTENKTVSETPKAKTRGKQKTVTPVTKKTAEGNVKRRRASIVITKKAPVLSPKPKRGQKVVKPETPKKAVSPVKTPKATRAKVVIAKPSPQMKPQGGKSRRGRKSIASLTPKQSKKAVIPKEVTPKMSPPKKARSKKSSPKKATPKQAKSAPKKTKMTPIKASPEKPKRGRRNANQTEVIETTHSKKSRQIAQKVVSPEKVAQKTPKKTVAKSAQKSPKRKANVTLVSPPKKAKRGATIEVVTPALPPRGRKRKAADETAPVPAKVAKNDTRGRSKNSASKVTPKKADKSVSPLKNTSRGKALKSQPAKKVATEAKSPVKSAESPIKRSRSTVKSAKSPVKSAKSPVKRSRSAVKSAKSSVKSAKSPVKRSRSAVKSAKSPVKSAKSPVKKSRSTVKSDKSPQRSAQSPVKSAKGSVKPAKPVKSPVKSAKTTKSAKSPAKPAPKTPKSLKGVTKAKAKSPVKKATPVKAGKPTRGKKVTIVSPSPVKGKGRSKGNDATLAASGRSRRR